MHAQRTKCKGGDQVPGGGKNARGRTTSERGRDVLVSPLSPLWIKNIWLIDRSNLTLGLILVDFEHQKFTLLIIPMSFYILGGDKSEIFLQTELFSKIGKFFNWFWLFSCFWKSIKNFDKKFLKYLYSQSITPHKLGQFFSKIGKYIF